jgi:hypothetical protein
MSRIVQDLLDQNNVSFLLNPPYYPQYNGACEAGIRSLKVRAHHIAAKHNRPGERTCDDVEPHISEGTCVRSTIAYIAGVFSVCMLPARITRHGVLNNAIVEQIINAGFIGPGFESIGEKESKLAQRKTTQTVP